MEKKVEFNNGCRTTGIKLSREDMYEYDIIGAVKDIVTDEEAKHRNFYHVTAEDTEITMEIQGYNMPSF